ncbi:MAG TPA: site-2 protease family protein [Tepidisphaeraceae bacterium]|jgi:Zn-dependent protease|nr:site-2 protease family protein [Tepidisphaeraceae bacterium]
MGWEDRPYYRDPGGQGGGIFRVLLFGSVPLFTLFNIRVRAHASLTIFVAFTMIVSTAEFGLSGCQAGMESMTILFLIVLLHELGHCFACRWVGGDADDVIMTPLGGLAMVSAPHRPGATFIAVAGGPAVNVLICAIAALAMLALGGGVPWNPLSPAMHHGVPHGWLNVYGYLFWIYSISLGLLLFNLLPIFPLDGGQLLQSILWFKLGYYRAMKIACVVGVVGGGILGLLGVMGRSLLLIFIAISGILTCLAMLRQLREMGPEIEYGEELPDFSASLKPDPPRKRRRPNRWVIRRLRRQAERDNAEQQRLDSILAKVSAHGINSLTWSERRALRRATERQRQTELEFSRRD